MEQEGQGVKSSVCRGGAVEERKSVGMIKVPASLSGWLPASSMVEVICYGHAYECPAANPARLHGNASTCDSITRQCENKLSSYRACHSNSCSAPGVLRQPGHGRGPESRRRHV